MVFFSNEMASILQYLTFPLEVIGLSLAFIEVRFPYTANIIDKYFVRRASKKEPPFSQIMNKIWQKGQYTQGVRHFQSFENRGDNGLRFAIQKLNAVEGGSTADRDG
ncbi:MAG: hypothetical protein ACI82A_001279 [Candidatus Azotimanducaceae bacterium]|jgi:hypothetical protein